MPAPKRPRRRSRKTRAKLDPRLDALLALDETKLERLAREERAAVEKRRKELDAALEELGDRAHRRLPLFAPVTTGIHFPKLDKWRPPLRRPHASVFIRSDASATDLKTMGARVRAQSGAITTALVPLNRIATLEQSIAVEAIELARPMSPLLDQTLPYTGLNTLQTGPPPHTGAGVVVGVIDTRLDVYHPDFRSAAGATRVLFLWDQTLVPAAGEAGPPVAPALPGFTPAGGMTYGVEYSQATIDAELTGGPPPYDTVRHAITHDSNAQFGEHGTHVTSIAAGNGLASAAPARPGAAPGADIIFVAIEGQQPQLAFADSVRMADAAAYIFARATALGRPCVINMSLGDNLGPHDGTSLGEQFLDGLLTVPSRAMTISAGNSTTRGEHGTGTVGAAATETVVLRYAAPADDHNSDAFELWYDGHDRFSVTVTTPGGTVIGPLAAGGGSLVQALPGGVQVTVTSVVNDPRNGDNVISIVWTVPGMQVLTGDWSIALTGTTVINGHFECWLDRNNRDESEVRPPHLDETRMTLGVPGSGRRTIAVGNHRRTGPPPDIRPTSGRGPTRDGRIKPDITTVGTDVMAARSRNQTLAVPGPDYISMSGTSMSAPLVAGTLALLFECRGAMLGWPDLLQVVQEQASTSMPAGVPAAPNDIFGYGWMQAANLCTAPDTQVDVWVRDDVGDTGTEPSSFPIICFCPDVELLDAAGAPIPNPVHDPTVRFTTRIRVTARNRGTGTARNVDVFLHWADPGTGIPFPAEWRAAGIYAGPAPGFAEETNRIVIPQIPAGGAVTVEFAWAPPAPGSGSYGGSHFCLLVRLEHPDDPSQIGFGGWSVIAARNNIGLRNVDVQPNARAGDAESGFTVHGTDDDDTLIVDSELAGGGVRIDLPVRALPWRDAKLIDKHGRRREPYGCCDEPDPAEQLEVTLKGDEVTERTGVTGARMLELADGIASFTLEDRRLLIPLLRVVRGAKMPARVRIDDIRTRGEQKYVHVHQLSGGRRVGSVTVELRKGLKHNRNR